MTLTWRLEAHAEPSPESWAALAPVTVPLATPRDVREAVIATLQSGPHTSAQIQAATGMPRDRVRVALWNMAAGGQAIASGMGRGSTWRLA